MYVTDCIKRAKRMRLGCVACGGHIPPGKCLIPDLLRSLLVSFWGETARVGRPTFNLVTVFESFKMLAQFKGVVPLRSEAREKIFS